MAEELESCRNLQTQLKLQQDVAKSFEMKLVSQKDLDRKCEQAAARVKQLELENKRFRMQLDQKHLESITTSSSSVTTKTQLGELQITLD